MIWEERVKAERAAERANRPKKPVPKKEEYEVEAIKGKTRSGADAMKKFTPSLGIPYLGV